MRVRGRKDQWPKRGQIQPVRQFTPDYPAVLAGPAARNDFDAAKLFGVGGEQKMFEDVERGLGGSAVQIKGARGRKFAGAKPVPT